MSRAKPETNILILLNDLMIDIMNDKKYFNNIEYENIKKINKSCEINYKEDCQVSINNKLNIQHYIFYFLLEFIKLNISENNNNNNNNNDEKNTKL
jgi:hypothetical protein